MAVATEPHQVAWLFGDRGIPATWRQMNGYGSHTYSWINLEGQIHWVKYHFLSDQGIQCLTQDEADRLVLPTVAVQVWARPIRPPPAWQL